MHALAAQGSEQKRKACIHFTRMNLFSKWNCNGNTLPHNWNLWTSYVIILVQCNLFMIFQSICYSCSLPQYIPHICTQRDWFMFHLRSNYKYRLEFPFKEELHDRFNLISEERVKNFKHNSENLMKIGWKIRKLWHFEVSQSFKKHFLTSRYEYANEWGDDVIASQFSINFVHRNDKNFIFQLWEC